MIEFKEPRKAIEWVIYEDRNFRVLIRGWNRGDEFKWNVYAFIFDTHPLFGKIDALMCAPFHGGVTYDTLITHEPARGIQYNWQKVDKFYKIGSDYSHHGDYYENDSYEDGIPPMIRHDSEELARHLYNCQAASE